MITQRVYVEGLGEVATSVGDLSTNVKDLNGKLISVRDDAYSRIHANVGQAEGTRVSMIVNYLKGENPILVKQDKFPVRLAKELVIANRQGRYFSTGSEKQYEQSAKLAEKEVKSGIAPADRKAILCPSRAVFSMSPSENPEHLAFVFEDVAAEYYKKNKQPIKFYPIDSQIVDETNGTIQNYTWFSGLDGESVLLGSGRDPDFCVGSARGVRGGSGGSAEGTRKNSVQIPTLSEILEYSKPFVPPVARKDFEKGLRKILGKG